MFKVYQSLEYISICMLGVPCGDTICKIWAYVQIYYFKKRYCIPVSTYFCRGLISLIFWIAYILYVEITIKVNPFVCRRQCLYSIAQADTRLWLQWLNLGTSIHYFIYVFIYLFIISPEIILHRHHVCSAFACVLIIVSFSCRYALQLSVSTKFIYFHFAPEIENHIDQNFARGGGGGGGRG